MQTIRHTMADVKTEVVQTRLFTDHCMELFGQVFNHSYDSNNELGTFLYDRNGQETLILGRIGLRNSIYGETLYD